MAIGEPLEKRGAREVREFAAVVRAEGIELLVSRQLTFERPLAQVGGPPAAMRASGTRDATFRECRIILRSPNVAH